MIDTKFRVWDKDAKEMYYQGNNSTRDNGIMNCRIMFDEMGCGVVVQLYGGEYKDITNFELMPCTGLKDKNGTEIYKGDIYDIGICTKIIRPDHFIEDTYELMKMLDDGAVVEVIGNIYANHELLKEVEDDGI